MYLEIVLGFDSSTPLHTTVRSYITYFLYFLCASKYLYIELCMFMCHNIPLCTGHQAWRTSTTSAVTPATVFSSGHTSRPSNNRQTSNSCSRQSHLTRLLLEMPYQSLMLGQMEQHSEEEADDLTFREIAILWKGVGWIDSYRSSIYNYCIRNPRSSMCLICVNLVA